MDMTALSVMQQCSDAIKRAQILKEKMGMPKLMSTPTHQTHPAEQIAPISVGTVSSQSSHATQGSLERQGSLPNQQPSHANVIGKATSMPAGSSSTLRAYAGSALQGTVEEVQEPTPSSPQRHVLGKCLVIGINKGPIFNTHK